MVPTCIAERMARPFLKIVYSGEYLRRAGPVKSPDGRNVSILFGGEGRDAKMVRIDPFDGDKATVELKVSDRFDSNWSSGVLYSFIDLNGVARVCRNLRTFDDASRLASDFRGSDATGDRCFAGQGWVRAWDPEVAEMPDSRGAFAGYRRRSPTKWPVGPRLAGHGRAML